VKRQEYYLGQYKPYISPGQSEADSAVAKIDEDDKKPPKRKFEEKTVAYYAVDYSQGTVCDINSTPRRTTVQYICDPNGKNQIESLNEVASCEYELVVLTPLICTHPAYKPTASLTHSIDCYPKDNAPGQPKALTLWEDEQSWEARKQLNAMFESPQAEPSAKPPSTNPTQQSPPVISKSVKKEVAPPAERDAVLMASFLAGTYCLYGGAGWWKHEYCHGKQVLQFHEQQGDRTELVLGRWNQAAHLQWIADNPHKAPILVNGQVRQVTQMYADGEYCEEVSKPRHVEVRLRCRESKGSGNSVTLYMLEPKTCEYILSVESSMFCELLQTADNRAMFASAAEMP
jgi:endoplasmic reticulum lectin 1